MQSIRFLRNNASWLAAGLLLAFASNFGQTFFISIFGAEFRAGMGLTDGEFGRLYTLATLGSAVLLVQTGFIADRFPARWLGAATMVALACVCVLMARVESVWLFGIAIFGLRFAGQGMLSHVEVTAVARWFAANRGKALAISSWGHPLGEGVLPPLVAVMLTQMHWRSVWIGCAIFLVLILMPLYLAILRGERQPKQEEAATRSVAGIGGRHWTRREVLRHRLFWLLIPALMASPLIGTAALFHQAHIVEIKDWTLVSFTSGFTAYAVLSVTFSIFFGVLVDRFSALAILPLYLLPLAAGMIGLGLMDSILTPLFVLGMIGASAGAGAATMGAMWAELYGTANLGAIRALSMAAMVFSTALGPGLTGTLIDWGIDFEAQSVPLGLWALAMAIWLRWLLHPVAEQRAALNP